MLGRTVERGQVVILCALAGCAGSGLADEPGPGVVTETDVEVFQLVFGDVSRQRFSYEGDGQGVLVSPTTPDHPPFIPPNAWKWSGYRAWPGIGELVAAMQARNAVAVRLPSFVFDGGEVGDSQTPAGEIWQVDWVDARYYVDTFLPAYSRDGRTAMVRFFLEPSPHGAMCTYLLSHGDAGWWVLRRDVAYYK